MGQCELCNASGPLFNAIVEGSRLNVCRNCGKYGKIVANTKKVNYQKKKNIEEPKIIELIVSEYASIVRSAREKQGQSQKEFASKLNEKESLIQKIESGNIKLSLELAKKLERLLKIKLVEKEANTRVAADHKKSGPLTIGDLIKIRK